MMERKKKNKKCRGRKCSPTSSLHTVGLMGSFRAKLERRAIRALGF